MNNRQREYVTSHSTSLILNDTTVGLESNFLLYIFFNPIPPKWSTPANFCQYLLIGMFSPPDFFLLCGSSFTFFKIAQIEHYTFCFESTGTKVK